MGETLHDKEQIFESLMGEDQRYFEGKRNWLRQQNLDEIFDEAETKSVLNALDSIDKIWENIYDTKQEYHVFSERLKENEKFLATANAEFEEMEKGFLNSLTRSTLSNLK
ncbi:hypothetical protein EIN_371340 [Entamoeba invadens IP1]|uniref:Uncharacterized protein n=1 Tax=Entamoeba invadens IP1 TaxID=370355 RepID=A0A0A1UGJ7_ENTIV|nr:hypothetical protein EIN_371340 [Entamoeba invadens IP1]ELP92722.1 hypothetical protein EIN_371340 [Entamoeba invadens IP1]|eukprot:XP_004259493.1 hypothetical protein EIN_371340 [Entamoeba invadens IP1]